jgi:myo-inositol-1(or 4)-monophosphatase
MHQQQQPILNIAVTAARKAGQHIVKSIERLDTVTAQSKGTDDFVTSTDKQAEAFIIDIIHKAYPHHAILAEESGKQDGHDFEWIIDPLDGTTNFMHGFPHCAVSIAVKQQDKLEYAVIYDPIRDDLFTASRGKGAYLNDRRIRVSSHATLDGALLGTGFPFRHKQQMPYYLETFKALLPQVADIRRAGSAALDLAYVASGQLDGFWELGLSIWDIAAGILLIREAGGLITDFSGGEKYLETGNIVTGNPKIITPLLKVIRESEK